MTRAPRVRRPIEPGDDEAILSAIAETGWVPEFVAFLQNRKPEDLTDKEFCDALFRETERRDNLHRERAQRALDAMNSYHDDDIPLGFGIDRDDYEVIIRECLDAGSLIHFVRLVLSDSARAAATVKHAKHRALREQVFRWCDGNMGRYRSMDAAAEAIAGKVVHVAFRTAREWIKSWPGLPAWRTQKSLPARRPYVDRA